MSFYQSLLKVESGKSQLYSSGKDLTERLTDARSAVGFCLGSGLFGSYNSD